MADEDSSPELLTQKQYARRRGWSKQYVHQLVKTGRIVLENGLIDIAAADVALTRHRDPARDAALTSPMNVEGIAVEAQVPPMARPSGAQPSGSFVKARTIREHYRAMREKLEYEELARRVFPLSEVEYAAMKLGTQVREGLMNGAAGIAAALTERFAIDTLEATALLEEHIALLLTRIADELETEGSPFGRHVAVRESQSS